MFNNLPLNEFLEMKRAQMSKRLKVASDETKPKAKTYGPNNLSLNEFLEMKRNQMSKRLKTTSDETKPKVKKSVKRSKASESTTLTKASDLTKALKLTDTGVDDDNNFKLQNYGDTNFPRNTPCYICGPKGSGKTYMLAGLLQYIFKQKLCQRIFYIYGENIDTTIIRAVPKNSLYQIPKKDALIFISKYLTKKSRFCSCGRFIKSYDALTKSRTLGALTIPELMRTTIYWDNQLDDLSKRKKFTTALDVYQYATKTMKKYTSGTVLRINSVGYNVGALTMADFDIIVIDDIAQFPDLFGTSRLKSPLYKYFTITRQNMTSFYMTGQDLMQLPRMFREQLGALVALKGTDLTDINKGYKVSKPLKQEIESRFMELSNHEGILYNYNTQDLEVIRN